MTKFTTKFAFIATAIAALASGNAAMAETGPSRAINLTRYDLSNPAEVQAVKSRIRHFARQVCGLDEHEGLAARAAKMECFNTAIAKGESQVETAIAYQAAKNADRTAMTSAGNRTIR